MSEEREQASISCAEAFLFRAVTRFIAVSVKTFVLCLGSGFGLMLALGGDTNSKWAASAGNCSTELDTKW